MKLTIYKPILLLLLLYWQLSAISIQNDLAEYLSTPTNNSFDNNEKLLSLEQAFKFTANRLNANTIKLNVIVAESCYLYKDKLTIEQGNGQQLLIDYPSAQLILDEITKLEFAIYDHSFSLLLQVPPSTKQLKINYQGCAKGKLCYPPHSLILDLQTTINSYTTNEDTKIAGTKQNSSYADLLSQKGFLFALLMFLLAGIGLCFTPCVLPMLPIACSLIVNNSKATKLQSFMLVATYVIGMSITMAVMGVITALFGAKINLQQYSQSPWLLVTIASLFVILAISMFGAYELQLPPWLQNKLNLDRKSFSRNNFLYAFLFGVIASVVVSPCVSAPLVGALIYIASTGDIILGGACLFMLGLGMGIPILIVSISGKSFLPKAGAWMLIVRALFGIGMLVVAISLVARFLSKSALDVVAGITIALIGYLFSKYISTTFSVNLANRLNKLCRFIMVFGIAIAISMPLARLTILNSNNKSQPITTEKITNITAYLGKPFAVNTIMELQQLLTELKQKNIPSLVLVHADWCLVCHKMASFMLDNSKIQELLAKIAYIKLDITTSDQQKREFLTKLNVFAPPAILFFDDNGNEIPQLRTLHAISPEEIVQKMNDIIELTK